MKHFSTTYSPDFRSPTSSMSLKYVKQAKHTVPVVYTELQMMHVGLQWIGLDL